MSSFLDNYRTFKKSRFGGEITAEKVENAEGKLNEQINAYQLEIGRKKQEIINLQKTKEWKRYSKSVKYNILHYILLYILSLLVVYCLSRYNIYPFAWIPDFFVLNFTDIVTLLWKSVLFFVIGFFTWELLNINIIFTLFPRIMARKQLREIYELRKEKEKIEEKQKEKQEELKKIIEYKQLANEVPTKDIINNLEGWLVTLKNGAKSDKMYQKLYSWVEFLYDIGYREAEKYEYIVLKCEEKVWLTPKEQRDYCIRRIEEITKNALAKGQYYSSSKYEMEYYSSGLNLGGNNSSAELSEDEAWHAVSSGMMGGKGIDSRGM